MGKHYVPQKYLQGFAVPENERLIWMYDKKTNKWARPAIKNVAQQRDYFPADIETRLTAEIENPANVVLDRLKIGGEISGNDREMLENYIGVMLMRVPRRRRKGFEVLPEVRGSTFSRIREEVAGLSADPEAIAKFLKEVDRLANQYESEVPHTIIDQIHSPWPSERVLRAIKEMTWRIVYAPSPGFFITSDNPAYFFEAYGIGSENAELTFPISSRVSLLGSHQGIPGGTSVVRVRTAVMKEINRRLISGAERFVFTPYRANWIEAVANKQKPYLSRIQWESDA